MTRPPQCNTCRFWQEDETTRDPNDADYAYGHCRRRPPILVDSLVRAFMPPLQYGQQADPDIECVTLFSASLCPATCSTDWCGEYEAPGWPLAGEAAHG